MRRLFVRTYVVLVAVVVAGLAVASAWERSRRERPDPSVVEALLAAPDDVRAAFATLPPDDAREQLSAELKARVEVLPYDRMPTLPPPVRTRLRRGVAAGPMPGGPPGLWVPLPDQQLLVHVRPQRPPRPPIPWIAAGVVLLLGVGIATQLRPLDRHLRELADAAHAFGEGDRDRRVDLPEGVATAELGSRFNAMADRIAGLLHGQRELLLAVSHELRTPLNRLRFASELLAGEPDPEARAQQLEALQGDLDELDALVGELLMWARLEHQPPARTEPVELAPMIAELLEAARRLQPEAHTQHTVPSDLSVSGDPQLLRRALGNLVSNAARYGSGRIEVSADRDGSRVHIHVDDDGEGIPASERSRVLEPFVRLDVARTRDGGGAGLGLALAARIASQHGGALTVGEAPLGGARLTLTLPVDER
ncbi:MAG: hypothetical protein KTR31_20675 [Myxococcales bacterium]|nr:hypothetical protein [Myxococcales bacterium]